MIFRNKTRTALMASAAATALLAPLAVEAQQITSAIQGTITTPTGSPASGATVTVRNTLTGITRSVTTTASGAYNIRNLPIGDGYTVSVSAEGYEDQTITGIAIDASGSANLSLALTAAGTAGYVEEITVSASAVNFSFQALGPGSVFSKREIRNLPSISRNINDVIRIDPRVQFDGNGVSCLGANRNFNSFTIDGVRSGDGFGLNGTGNLSRNTFPIPFDSVAETSVEFAPVDVQYGRFSGCQINVISQKGTNEFHGSAFFIYNNDSLSGDTFESGAGTVDADFDRYQWGADLGGPIIEDKLFFYASYEEFSTSNFQQTGPDFLGFARPQDARVEGRPLEQGDLDRFASILSSSYGRDPELLEVVRTLPQTNRRFFGRLDWNINDMHRVEATYARLEESTIGGDDIDSREFTFRDNFTDRGTSSDAVSVRLYSDWTDNLSTDLRISRQSVTDVQDPIGGGEAQNEDFPRIAVARSADDVNGTFGPHGLISGPGIFRAANELNYETDQIRFQATYVEGDHEFLAGYELESVEVFNLFLFNGTGTLVFEDFAALEAGTASRAEFRGSFTGDPRDAAASFTNDIHALYFQDKWQVTDRLQLTGGLRYEWYDSDDEPIANPVFQERYGFSNTQSFDGLEIWLPRLGLQYTLPEDTFGNTTISAGAGVFSVAGPVVWFANSFQNFGGAIGFANQGDCEDGDLQVLQGGQFTGIPQCLRDAAALDARNNTGNAEAVDPNFTLPSQTRLSFGIEHFTDSSIDFFDGWRINTDFIYSISNDEIEYLDLTLTPLVDDEGNILRTPDGRTRLNAIDPLRAGCNAVFVSPGVGFTNVTPECDSGGDDQDILLRNAERSGRSLNLSIQLNKTFQLGDVTTLDVRGGYAFSDVTLGTTGSNSTATSGFEETVRPTPNTTVLAPAPFQNAHSFTLAATIAHEFVEDYQTSLTVFWSGREGNPFSYTFADASRPRASEAIFGDSDDEERILPYIPTGPNDPLVDFSNMSQEEQTAFFNFLEESGLNQFAGEIAQRNRFRAPWNTDIDLRFQQELPGFFENDRFRLFIDMENFLNFIDSGIGNQRTINNGNVAEGVPLVDARLSDDGSQYIYSGFFGSGNVFDRDGQDALFRVNPNPTLWRLNLGIRYEF